MEMSEGRKGVDIMDQGNVNGGRVLKKNRFG